MAQVDPERYWIPVDTANQILATFGITKPSAVYERRLRPDGFRLIDFNDVLFESRFVFIMDWRGELDEFVATVLPALGEMGCELTYEPEGDDGAVSGILISTDSRIAAIRYVPTEGGDFDEVIRAFARLCPETIEFRQTPGNKESDTWVYAALSRDEWRELEKLEPVVIRHFFEPM